MRFAREIFAPPICCGLVCLLPLLALLIPAFNFTNGGLNPGEFRATVLDIGQGMAVLVETSNKRLFYDTGPIQGRHDDAGQRTTLPYLRGRGIDHIDRMVISHSDSDHVGGAASLLQHISFDSMLGSLPANNPLLLTLQAKNLPSISCRYGQYWVWDEVDFNLASKRGYAFSRSIRYEAK